MTTINFSKTRIVYWSGVEDQLKYPKDYNSLPAGVSQVLGDVNWNYSVYKIDANTHNWHSIPMNYYGLYCTNKELLCLVQNSDTIKPLKMSHVVGHSIPLNTTSNGSTSNLSFNNTIYSLIHDLPPNDWVYPKPFLQNDLKTPNVFFSTFDGGRKDNGFRLELPKQDLLFKVPWTDKDQSGFPVNIEASGTYTDAQVNAGRPVITTEGVDNIYLTQNNLVNMYLPELLQVNQCTKALYPGENQDTLNINIEDKGLATIDASMIRTNEFIVNRDDRTYGINLTAPFDYLSYMNIVPMMTGVDPNWKVDDSNDFHIYTPFFPPVVDRNSASDEINTAHDFKLLFLRELIRTRHNDSELANYSNLIPCKLVKCLPIVDNTDTQIAHTVCATVTWNLTVEVTMSLLHVQNPYNSEHPYKEYVKVLDGTGTIRRHELYTRRWPFKPMADTIMKDRKRRFYATDRDLNNPHATHQTWDRVITTKITNVPATEFIDPNAYATGILPNQPTNKFHPSNDVDSKLRRSKRLSSSSSKK